MRPNRRLVLALALLLGSAGCSVRLLWPSGQFEVVELVTLAADQRAALLTPRAVAFDTEAHLYVADAGHSRIQVFNLDGDWVRTIGSRGRKDGQFDRPFGVAVAPNGDVLVADTYNHRIQRLDKNGRFCAAIGSHGTGKGQMSRPAGVATDAEGNVFVADTGNNRVLRIASGQSTANVWSTHTDDGVPYRRPYGIAASRAGTLLVADQHNGRLVMIDRSGRSLALPTIEELALGLYEPRTDGSGEPRPRPTGGAFGPEGLVYAVGRPGIWRLVRSELSTFEWIPVLDDWIPWDACFEGVAADDHGLLAVSDSTRHVVFVDGLSRGTVVFGHPPGVSTQPTRLTAASGGGAYVMDPGTGLYCLGADGDARWLMGCRDALGSGNDGVACVIIGDRATVLTDGTPTRGFELSSVEPSRQFGGVAVLANGSIVCLDNAHGQVVAFDSEGRFTTQWGRVGSGEAELMCGRLGVTDDDQAMDQAVPPTMPDGIDPESPALVRAYAGDIAADAHGSVCVADTWNHRVQGFDSKGQFIRMWGRCGASDSAFRWPCGIGVDRRGRWYVADTMNHRIQVFTNHGEYIGRFGYFGNANDQLAFPLDVAVDAGGNVFVADTGNSRIAVYREMPIWRSLLPRR